MRLKSLKLSLFRGYRTTTVIPSDEAMTGSVGRNDDGQSASLRGRARLNRQDAQCVSR